MFARRSALSSSMPSASVRYASLSAKVLISERHSISLLQVSAFTATTAETEVELSALLGLTNPDANHFSGGTELCIRSIAPGVWQIQGEPSYVPHPDQLRKSLHGIATVVDLSHARTNLIISGPSAAQTLAKFCGLDLHSSKFKTGSSTQTRFGHIGMTLSRINDDPTFEILVFRGYAQHVFESLVESAAEYGVRVVA